MGGKSDLSLGLKYKNTLILGPEETIMFKPSIPHSRSQNTGGIHNLSVSFNAAQAGSHQPDLNLVDYR